MSIHMREIIKDIVTPAILVSPFTQVASKLHWQACLSLGKDWMGKRVIFHGKVLLQHVENFLPFLHWWSVGLFPLRGLEIISCGMTLRAGATVHAIIAAQMRDYSGTGIGWNTEVLWQKFTTTRFYGTVILHCVGDMPSSQVWSIEMDFGICRASVPSSSTNFLGICWNKRKFIDRSHSGIMKYMKWRHIKVRCVRLNVFVYA